MNGLSRGVFVVRTIFAPKYTIALPYLLSLLAMLFLPFTPQNVSVEIVSTVPGGAVYLAVYDCAEGFANDEHVFNARQVLREHAVRTEMDLQLPRAGAYVLAAFQDLNGNGELDRNLLGVPTEPYGFGQLPPSKWRAPAFGEVVSRIDGTESLTIEMRHWKDY